MGRSVVWVLLLVLLVGSTGVPITRPREGDAFLVELQEDGQETQDEASSVDTELTDTLDAAAEGLDVGPTHSQEEGLLDHDNNTVVVLSALTKFGVTDSVLIPHRDIPESKSFTLLVWLMPTATDTTWAAIFHKGTKHAERTPAMWFIPHSRRLLLRLNTGEDGTTDVKTKQQLPLNRFSHVAVTVDQDTNTAAIYLNGKEAVRKQLEKPVVFNDGDLHLGASFASRGFQGFLTHFRWVAGHPVLTPNAIREDYYAGAPTAPAVAVESVPVSSQGVQSGNATEAEEEEGEVAALQGPHRMTEEEKLCDSYVTCAECLQQSACGWCGYDRQCVWRESHAAQSCLNFQYDMCEGEPCAIFSNCLSCLSGGCGWCGEYSICLGVEKADECSGLTWATETCPADCGPHHCSQHGECVQSDSGPRCVCDMGWAGYDCARDTSFKHGTQWPAELGTADAGMGQYETGVTYLEGEPLASDGDVCKWWIDTTSRGPLRFEAYRSTTTDDKPELTLVANDTVNAVVGKQMCYGYGVVALEGDLVGFRLLDDGAHISFSESGETRTTVPGPLPVPGDSVLASQVIPRTFAIMPIYRFHDRTSPVHCGDQMDLHLYKPGQCYARLKAPDAPGSLEVQVKNLRVGWLGADPQHILTYYIVERDTGKGGPFQEYYRGNETRHLFAHLKGGTTYSFRAKSCTTEEALCSEWSDVGRITTLTDVPDQPAIPIVKEKGKRSAELEWVAPEDNGLPITQLTLELTYMRDQSVRTVYEGLNTSTVVSGLIPGKNYCFRLKATNTKPKNHGDSVWSAPVCIWTDPDRPATPDPVALEDKSDNHISISWTAPDDHGKPILTFLVEKRDEFKKTTSFECEGLELACLTESLTPGQYYQFRVRARNVLGDSDWSEVSRIRTVPLPPNRPTDVEVVRLTSRAVRISFHAPFDNGEPIENYRLEYEDVDPEPNPYAPVERKKVDLGPLSPSPATEVADLVPGRFYNFTVRAVNSVGESGWSDIVHVEMLSDVPDIPPAPLLIRKEERGTMIRWTAPYHNGKPIDQYEVQYRGPEGEWKDTFACSADQPLEYYKAALKPATRYNFRVRAINRVGPCEWSKPLSVVTLTDRPEKVAALKIPDEAVTAFTVGVAWDEAVPNGLNVTTYEVEMAGPGLSTPEDEWVQVFSDLAQDAQIGELRAATDFKLRVRAINAKGPSDWTETSFHTKTAPPFAPETPEVVADTPYTLDIEWHAPHDNGASITEHELEVDDGMGGEYEVRYTGTATKAHVDELVPGRKYRFRARARNAKGWGEKSTYGEFTMRLSVPEAPVAVTGVDRTGTTLTMAWRPPLRDNGSPIIKYTVEMDDGGGVDFARVFEGPETKFTADNLKPNTEYNFRVSAWNKIGEGPFTEDVGFQTDTAPPDAPDPPEDGGAEPRAFSVTWKAPADNGEEVQGYRVEVADVVEGTTGPWRRVYQGADEEFREQDLLPFTEYSFRVFASNIKGESAPSAAATFKTMPDKPEAATPPVAAAVSLRSLTLKWDAPHDNGEEITTFHLEMWKDSTWEEVYAAGNQSFTIENLEPGTRYRVRVSAENSVGVGGMSKESSFVTAVGPPMAPETPSVAALGARQTKIEWEEPEDNGRALTLYQARYLQNGSAEGQTKLTQQASGTSRLLEHLTPNTGYNVWVRALNSMGASLWCTPALIFTTETAEPEQAKPPEILNKASAVGRQLARTAPHIQLDPDAPSHCTGAELLHLEAPVDNGEAITSFDVDWDVAHWKVAYDTPGDWKLLYNGTQKDIIVSGFCPGYKYRFRVRANNAKGSGPMSLPGEHRPAAQVPGPPDQPTTPRVSARKFWIEWKEPDGRGADIDLYQFQTQNLNVSGEWTSPVQVSARQLGRWVRALPDTAYGFRVRGHNSVGWGVWSSPGKVQTRDDVPETPNGPTEVAKWTHWIIVQWNAPEDNGRTIDKYELTVSDGRTAEIVYTGLELSFNVTTHKKEPLDPYAVYTFSVRAHNALGWSSSSPTSNLRTHGLPPCKPQNVTLLAFSSTMQKVKWDRDASQECTWGGMERGAVTRYWILERDDGRGGAFRRVYGGRLTTWAWRVDIRRFYNNKQDINFSHKKFRYRVQAVSNLGRSEWSDDVELWTKRPAHVSHEGQDIPSAGSPDKPFKTLKYALSQSVYGDLIKVHKGTYSGVGWNDVEVNKWVLVDGSGATLDGRRASRALHAVSRGVLHGFVLENGVSAEGGGLQLSGGSELRYVTIQNCEAQTGGGVLVVGPYPRIMNSKILNNRATLGGGGGIYSRRYLRIHSTTISGNTAANGNGGGIYVRRSTLVLNYATVTDNTAQVGHGGGLFLDAGYQVLYASTLRGNTAKGNGGGIYHYGSSGRVQSCTLDRNKAENGGGSYLQSANILYYGGSVVNNKALDQAPAMFFTGVSFSRMDRVNVTPAGTKTGVVANADARVFLHRCTLSAGFKPSGLASPVMGTRVGTTTYKDCEWKAGGKCVEKGLRTDVLGRHSIRDPKTGLHLRVWEPFSGRRPEEMQISGVWSEQQDATFEVALAPSGRFSHAYGTLVQFRFVEKNGTYPGTYYLRMRGDRWLDLDKDGTSPQTTFLLVPGLSGRADTFSFESPRSLGRFMSMNPQNYYAARRRYRANLFINMWINYAQVWRERSTFEFVKPLYTEPPPIVINEEFNKKGIPGSPWALRDPARHSLFRVKDGALDITLEANETNAPLMLTNRVDRGAELLHWCPDQDFDAEASILLPHRKIPTNTFCGLIIMSASPKARDWVWYGFGPSQSFGTSDIRAKGVKGTKIMSAESLRLTGPYKDTAEVRVKIERRYPDLVFKVLEGRTWKTVGTIKKAVKTIVNPRIGLFAMGEKKGDYTLLFGDFKLTRV
eukprot:TRINITY_DN6288_c0_g1_i1.p1 TRINITY_DN6288_c0_g1~~TRINITY_DN6288_c0_g1_i1.p1  ORF type:complete len:2864 (-),score=586.82 TRINITY_DN6288_c0_g1_i1:48-8639(-)